MSDLLFLWLSGCHSTLDSILTTCRWWLLRSSHVFLPPLIHFKTCFLTWNLNLFFLSYIMPWFWNDFRTKMASRWMDLLPCLIVARQESEWLWRKRVKTQRVFYPDASSNFTGMNVFALPLFLIHLMVFWQTYDGEEKRKWWSRDEKEIKMIRK